jgi:DNA-binding NtrC family response regulator
MSKQISIIIVDDDDSVLDSVQAVLSSHGYHCKTARNGKCALELINEAEFDIMITDIKMPHMNGLELTKRVKELKPDIRVILMTGYFGKFSHDEAIAAGASDFLEKPFSLKALVQAVKDS